MKPTPAPHIPGNIDAERFDHAVRKNVHRLKNRRAQGRSKAKTGAGAKEAGREDSLTCVDR
jgi:hypothetical protein